MVGLPSHGGLDRMSNKKHHPGLFSPLPRVTISQECQYYTPKVYTYPQQLHRDNVFGVLVGSHFQSDIMKLILF